MRRCLSGTAEYRLNDHVAIETNGKTLHGGVQARSGGFRGYSLPAIGSLGGYCVSGWLSLGFNPGLVVKANLTTLLYIDVPKHIKATYSGITSPYGGKASIKKKRIIADTIGIPDPINRNSRSQYSYVVVRSKSEICIRGNFSSCQLATGAKVSMTDVDGC